jgi:hypothetical protein
VTSTAARNPADVGLKVAWSRRVRKVGGYIQLAFAAFWLVRGGQSLGGVIGAMSAIVGVVLSAAVLVYALLVSVGVGGRPTGPDAKRIERSVTVATVLELIASFAFPVIVIAAGHSDWVLPSIAITIGPLLLWLDHAVHLPRLRPVGWLLTVGPVVLVVVLSGDTLAATTGLAAGALLLGTAAAGFHDLAVLRPQRRSSSVQHIPAAP